MPIDRRFFLDLARSGLRMPIGTHLVLQEKPDSAAIVLDGERLGEVIVETAQRFGTPLAIPLMDLTLEKAALLRAGGVPESQIDAFHFTEPAALPADVPLSDRMFAACVAVAHVARRHDLVPVGMCIGPFSLTTKLVADPITPVFLAGTGESAAEHQEIAVLEAALAAAERVIATYVDAQIEAGARALLVCEPAANRVYFSPNQLAESYAVFDRYVMDPMRRLAERLARAGVALIFHDCGELTDGMVDRFATLGASVLSFGSSRNLWEDAARVPADTVLYGNLPTKQFYAPQLTVGDVERLAVDVIQKMRATGHPFILGSECDVLSVPGSEQEILSKVNAFMRCPCHPSALHPRTVRME
jgi:uroporphyrinogen-III decarboxylase